MQLACTFLAEVLSLEISPKKYHPRNQSYIYCILHSSLRFLQVITAQTAQTTYVSLNRTLVQYSHGALAAVLCFALYICLLYLQP